MWGRTEQGLSAEEKRFAGRWRLINLVTKRFFIPLTNAQNQQLHLSLCGGDAGLLGQHMGQIQALQSLLVSVLSPWIASVSDRYGRMRLMAVSRCSWLVWFALVSRVRTMRERLLLEVATACIYRTEVVVFNAAHVDVFGSRPELSSRLKSRQAAYHAATGLIGPLIGAALAQANESWGFYASFAACILQFGCALMCEETLPKEQRKPFTGWAALLRRSNPLANIRLLFRSGTGLRALSISSICWNAVGTIWSSMDSYRLGARCPTLALLPSGLPEDWARAQDIWAGRQVSKAR